MMLVAGPAAVALNPQTISIPLRSLLSGIRSAVPDSHLVGGALRDLLIGREPYDLDIVTRSDAHAAAASLAASLGGHVFALDEERAQYRIVLVGAGPVRDIDVSRVSSIEADLARRDFTLNAMAAPIEESGTLGQLIDPFGGAGDAEDRCLRMISEAVLRDDPLRLLRAARLATELGLAIEPETADTVRRLAPQLEAAAAERRRDEFVRILGAPNAADGVRLLDGLGLLAQLLPELDPARACEQPSNHHYWDVFNHSVEAVAALDEMLDQKPTSSVSRPWLGPIFRAGFEGFPLREYLEEKAGGSSRRVLLKLSALLHDVAKPQTKRHQPDGRIRFFGHPEIGAETATLIGRRLRFSGREIRLLGKLVEEHLRPTQLSQSGLPSQRALYRYFRDLGEAAPACLVLSLADAAAATGPRLEPERWRGHVAYAAHVLSQGGAPVRGSSKASRIVDGGDLMNELKLEPGPLIGRLIEAVDEAHAVGEVKTREEALAYAARVLKAERAQQGGPA
jgi:poly(A) polymerase